MSFTTSLANNSFSRANSSSFESNFILSLNFERYDSTLNTVTNNQSAFVLFEMTTRHLSFYKDVFLTHRIFSSFSLSSISSSSSDNFISVSVASLAIDTSSTSTIMTYQLVDFIFAFCDIFSDQNNISTSR